MKSSFLPIPGVDPAQRQTVAQTKFAFLLSIAHVAIVAVFCAAVRYDHTATEVLDGGGGHGALNEREAGIKKMELQYPLAQDIQMMLFLGFGFLMTFLRRFGYSALVQTMVVIVVSVEWAVIMNGFTRMEDGIIYVGMENLIDASVGSAAVLISFGAIIGKVNLLQLLAMTLIEIPLYVANSYIGFTKLQVSDPGGTIFIHAFGAYFGLFFSLAMRGRDYGHSDEAQQRQNSRYNSDLFSFLGTLVLWVYWPSFNALLTFGSSRQRATINTYLALCASTITTMITSCLLGSGRRINAVDLQNATLSGGVVVGAVASSIIRPFGAVIAGSAAGVIATLGYQMLQGVLLDKLNLHDSCGVNNLHGMPAVVGGLFSAVIALVSEEGEYGQALYDIYPARLPAGNATKSNISGITNQTVEEEGGGGEGRSASEQALMQLASLGLTLCISALGGLFCGSVLTLGGLFDPVDDENLFDDAIFFNLPDSPTNEEDEEEEGGEEGEGREYEVEEFEKDSMQGGGGDPTIVRVRHSITSVTKGEKKARSAASRSPPPSSPQPTVVLNPKILLNDELHHPPNMVPDSRPSSSPPPPPSLYSNGSTTPFAVDHGPNNVYFVQPAEREEKGRAKRGSSYTAWTFTA